MDEKQLRDLRLKLNQTVESMQALVAEANERAGGDSTKWADEDKESYDRMVAEFGETQSTINELEAENRAETLREATKLAEQPVNRIAIPSARAKDAFWSRRLDLMAEDDRKVAKSAYWQTLSCLTWAGLKNGIAMRSGGRPTHDGFEIAIKQGIPRDVVDRFRDAEASEQWRLGITDGAGQGGELVPEDFQAELTRDMAGFTSVLRAGASVRPTTGSVATYPGFQSRSTPDPKQYPTGFVGVYAAEGKGLSGGTVPPQQNQPATEQIKIPVHLWAPDAIEITRELLEDTPVALEDEIRQVIVETRGLDYDRSFLLGSGAGEPEGVTNSGATSVAFTLTDVGTKWDSIVNLYTDLPQQYRDDPTAGFIMSSGFLGELLKMKETTANTPFFVIVGTAPTGAVPMTLWGKPIYISEFLDQTVTSTDVPCLWGAWRHYRVVERRDLMIQRLVERFVPNIGFFASSRVGGKVLRVAGFRLLTVA